MSTIQAAHRTIGTDKGYGDTFLVRVRYEDGAEGAITVYGRNLQSTHALLELFAPIWRFTTIEMMP